jgi:maleylpyruvate isomerase
MSDRAATPPPDFRADLAAVDRQTDLLLATVRTLDPGSVEAPSLCAGWTRGHVLTHVSRNADALLNLVTNATTGATTPMYASPESRDGDIEAGAHRPMPEQLADLETSAVRFRAAAEGLTEEVADVKLAARNNTSVRARFLPFMRLREVVFHHVDLDAGFGFADVEDDLVLPFVEDLVRRLRANPETPSMTIRTDEGDAWSIGDGQPTVSGSRTAVLAWLARGQTAGLVGDLPTLPFGG